VDEQSIPIHLVAFYEDRGALPLAAHSYGEVHMTTKLVRSMLSLGLAAFALLIAAGSGWTQVTTGDIRGRVIDTGQQPIEGVQISVLPEAGRTVHGYGAEHRLPHGGTLRRRRDAQPGRDR
jgi:hypothetical protein